MNIDSDRSRTPSDPSVSWCPITAVERANLEGMPRMGRRGSERSIMTVESVPEERESVSSDGKGLNDRYIGEVMRVGARQAALNMYSPNIVWVGRGHVADEGDVSPLSRPQTHRVDTNDILDLYLDDESEARGNVLHPQRVVEITAQESASPDETLPENDAHTRKLGNVSRKSSLAHVLSAADTCSSHSSLLGAPIETTPPVTARRAAPATISIDATLPLRRDVSPRDRSAYRASIYQRMFSRQHQEVNNMPLQPLKSAMKQPNVPQRRRASTVRTHYRRDNPGCCVIQ